MIVLCSVEKISATFIVARVVRRMGTVTGQDIGVKVKGITELPRQTKEQATRGKCLQSCKVCEASNSSSLSSSAE